MLRSYRSAHICDPVAGSISWAVTSTLSPERLSVPVTRALTRSSWAIFCGGVSFPLKRITVLRAITVFKLPIPARLVIRSSWIDSARLS